MAENRAANTEVERLVSIHRRPKSRTTSQSDRLTAKQLKTPTPEAPLIISVSELRDFLRCRVMHNLRHQVRVEPKQGSLPLGIGSLSHAILNAWYQVDHAKRTLARMEKIAKSHTGTTKIAQLHREDKELVEAMTIGYADWTLNPENENSDVQVGYENGWPEEWFTVPLDEKKTILLRGKYDNRFVPTTMKKTLALFEFKTAKQIKMSKFEQNLQVGGYAAAMRHDFPTFKRYIIYPTVMRKQLPGPRVKADLFARQAIELTDEECAIWVADARRAALDMLDAAVYASPMDSCEWSCDYRGPCLMRGNPEDMAYILKTEYQPKEYRP